MRTLWQSVIDSVRREILREDSSHSSSHTFQSCIDRNKFRFKNFRGSNMLLLCLCTSNFKNLVTRIQQHGVGDAGEIRSFADRIRFPEHSLSGCLPQSLVLAKTEPVEGSKKQASQEMYNDMLFWMAWQEFCVDLLIFTYNYLHLIHSTQLHTDMRQRSK